MDISFLDGISLLIDTGLLTGRLMDNFGEILAGIRLHAIHFQRYRSWIRPTLELPYYSMVPFGQRMSRSHKRSGQVE